MIFKSNDLCPNCWWPDYMPFQIKPISPFLHWLIYFSPYEDFCRAKYSGELQVQKCAKTYTFYKEHHMLDNLHIGPSVQGLNTEMSNELHVSSDSFLSTMWQKARVYQMSSLLRDLGLFLYLLEIRIPTGVLLLLLSSFDMAAQVPNVMQLFLRVGPDFTAYIN